MCGQWTDINIVFAYKHKFLVNEKSMVNFVYTKINIIIKTARNYYLKIE